MILVVNKHKHTPTNNDIYIGRGSPVGNPFTHKHGTKAQHVCESREDAINNYKKWFNERIEKKDDKAFLAYLKHIYLSATKGDVNLVCYCKPQSCHGDVIKEFIKTLIIKNEENIEADSYTSRSNLPHSN